MTYTAIKPTTKPAKLPTSCSNCPKFKDYQDNRGRGWCQLFNHVSFKQHPFTRDCELNQIDESDILHSEHEIGSLVKLIDSTLDHTQWTTFIVVGKRYNSNRYRNTKTYLSETDWEFLLATTSDPLTDLIWVREDEICHHNQADLINPQGEF